MRRNCHYISDKRPSISSEEMVWWVALEFVPNADNMLAVSVGAYLNRPGRCPVPGTRQMEGSIRILKFKDEAIGKLLLIYIS